MEIIKALIKFSIGITLLVPLMFVAAVIVVIPTVFIVYWISVFLAFLVKLVFDIWIGLPFLILLFILILNTSILYKLR